MSILYMNGAEAGNAARGRLVNVTNSVTAFDRSGSPPAGSPTTYAYRGNAASISKTRWPWYKDDTSTFYEAPDTGYAWAYAYEKGANSTNNDLTYFGVARSTSSDIIAVSTQDTTQLVTLRIGGVVVATAASAVLALTTWARVLVHVTAVSAGSYIYVYVDTLATPAIAYQLTAGNVTTIQAFGLPNEFLWNTQVQGDYIDDVVIIDPNDATGLVDLPTLMGSAIRGRTVTADGTYSGWTGTFADIDDIPANDTDYINATAVDQHSSFLKDPIVADADALLAVKIYARVVKPDATAGDNLEIELDDGVNQTSVTVPAPASGDVSPHFETDPAGSDWTTNEYDACEIGFYSRT